MKTRIQCDLFESRLLSDQIFYYRKKDSVVGKRHFVCNLLQYVQFISDLYGHAKTYLNFQKNQITYLMFIFFWPNHTSSIPSATTSSNFIDLDATSANFTDKNV